MGKATDWTGKRIGKLVIIKQIESVRKPNGIPVRVWRVKCDCGNEISMRASILSAYLTGRRSMIASCGCEYKKSFSNFKFKDWTGVRVGRLVVIENLGHRGPSGHRRRVWKAKCDCGKEIEIEAGNLSTAARGKRVGKRYDGISCGCARTEAAKKFGKTHGATAGGKASSEYASWSKMRQRCLNKKCKEYKWYGANGITICDRWLESFENFLADMGEKPNKNLTIERINGLGNYEPGNCRWATKKEQSRNTRRTVRVEYKGKIRSLADLAEEAGLKNFVVYQRVVKLGWSVEDALQGGRATEVFLEMDGERMSIHEWAKKYSMKPMLLYGRLHTGHSLKEALSRKKYEPPKFEINGESKTLSEWSKIYDMPRGIVKNRVASGWSALDALTTTIGKRKK